MENKSECTINDLCRMYNVTSMTVLRWRKRGLPYKIVGTRSVMFDLAEVVKWISDNELKEVKYNYEKKESSN